MERIIPAAPHNCPPISKATIAANGFTLTREPTILGVIKLDSAN